MEQVTLSQSGFDSLLAREISSGTKKKGTIFKVMTNSKNSGMKQLLTMMMRKIDYTMMTRRKNRLHDDDNADDDLKRKCRFTPDRHLDTSA